MKKNIFVLLIISVFLYSCGSDEDICLGGEATPRLKVKFKSQSSGKERILDSVFISVDYGQGAVPVILRKEKTDSVLVPLRVDESNATDLYISLSEKGTKSKIRLNYTMSSQYVSPACGAKRTYENLSPVLKVPLPVLGVEKNQNEITDENKTHLFLLF